MILSSNMLQSISTTIFVSIFTLVQGSVGIFQSTNNRTTLTLTQLRFVFSHFADRFDKKHEINLNIFTFCTCQAKSSNNNCSALFLMEPNSPSPPAAQQPPVQPELFLSSSAQILLYIEVAGPRNNCLG